MPEGDTIWRAARRLDAALAGRVLSRADLRVPQHATAALGGWTVESVRSRGKHLLTDLSLAALPDRPVVLHTTLGMDGSWRTFTPGAKWNGGPGHTIRAVLGNADVTAVGYRLTHVDLLAAAREDAVVGHLGPDLLGADWDAQRAVANLRAQPARDLGEALLDQRNLAGIGNVYKSELCFLAGQHPLNTIQVVENLNQIVEDSHRLLMLNRASSQRVTTGDPRRPAWVYSRGGQPCRKCGTAIASGEFGPPTRTRFTWWCPKCQPLR